MFLKNWSFKRWWNDCTGVLLHNPRYSKSIGLVTERARKLLDPVLPPTWTFWLEFANGTTARTWCTYTRNEDGGQFYFVLLLSTNQKEMGLMWEICPDRKTATEMDFQRKLPDSMCPFSYSKNTFLPIEYRDSGNFFCPPLRQIFLPALETDF